MIFRVLNNSISFENCDVTMIISTLGRVHFRIYFLNCATFGHGSWSFNKYIHKQFLQEKWNGGLILKFSRFLIHQPAAISQKSIMMIMT